MTNAFAPNRADSLVDWVAALLFAALIGYACMIVGGAKASAAGAPIGLLAGVVGLRRISSARMGMSEFVPTAFGDLAGDADELLLDDPLGEPTSTSRVVKLFAPGESSPAALVARIEDYLGRDGERATRPLADEEAPKLQADASAALHAALSNIRASLR